MNQKVKLQVSCDIEDVPNLCSVTLQEAIENVEKLHLIIVKAKQSLGETTWNDVESMTKTLEAFDSCRALLGKIDNRLGDSSSVIYSLTDILTKKDSVESKEEVKDDSIVAG